MNLTGYKKRAPIAASSGAVQQVRNSWGQIHRVRWLVHASEDMQCQDPRYDVSPGSTAQLLRHLSADRPWFLGISNLATKSAKGGSRNGFVPAEIWDFPMRTEEECDVEESPWRDICFTASARSMPNTLADNTPIRPAASAQVRQSTIVYALQKPSYQLSKNVKAMINACKIGQRR